MALSPEEALSGGRIQLTDEEQAVAVWIEEALDRSLIHSYPEKHKIGMHGGASISPIKLFNPAIEAELRKRYRAAGWKGFEVRPMSEGIYKFILTE